jgi:nitrogen regulatory protein PII
LNLTIVDKIIRFPGRRKILDNKTFICPVDNELNIQTLKYLHAFPS